jgi:hypothetical protein
MRSPLLLVLSLGFLVGACGDDDPKLKVTNLAPIKGDTDGGTYVVIQGTVVRFQSDTELIVQAPGGKPDEVVDVLVIFDPGGQLKIPNAFTFVDKDDTGPSIDDLNTSKPATPKKK